ncbi:hypothetical protein EAE96_000768 [Botrytis aclada]|nr:hypothetical protein EAE96_000768 [Botrytis aclada]
MNYSNMPPWGPDHPSLQGEDKTVSNAKRERDKRRWKKFALKRKLKKQANRVEQKQGNKVTSEDGDSDKVPPTPSMEPGKPSLNGTDTESGTSNNFDALIKLVGAEVNKGIKDMLTTLQSNFAQ